VADHDQRRVLQADRRRGREEGPGPERIQEHVFIVKLVNDKNDKHRIAGAVGFSLREHRGLRLQVQGLPAGRRAAARTSSVRAPSARAPANAWSPVWNAGSTYAMAAEAGAELTMMESRFVPIRFKDGYGPVDAWFQLFKAKAINAFGEVYMDTNKALLEDFAPYGQTKVPPSCLRNHLMLQEMREGRGPIYMDTVTALGKLAETMTPKEIKHLEAEAWGDLLDMCIAQAGVWAGENIEPQKKNSELMPTEPYLLGSTLVAAVSGPPVPMTSARRPARSIRMPTRSRRTCPRAGAGATAA
jgi:adenylylsulfate reductase subunit A